MRSYSRVKIVPIELIFDAVDAMIAATNAAKTRPSRPVARLMSSADAKADRLPELAQEFAARPAPDASTALQAVAERHFGPQATPLVRQAWTKFSRAFRETYGMSPAQWRRTIDRLSLHQIDSVNILVRAHYMPAFSRLGPYDRSLIDAAAWGAKRQCAVRRQTG